MSLMSENHLAPNLQIANINEKLQIFPIKNTDIPLQTFLLEVKNVSRKWKN